MPENSSSVGVESPKDFGTKVSWWNAELETAEKATRSWREDARKISNRYTLESRKEAAGIFDDYIQGRFNILWSNVEIMRTGVYGREPIPVVKRMHRDPDPVARLSSEMLERALKTEMERDERLGCGLDDVLMRSTLDLLLTARGVAWVRYEPDMEGATVLDERCPVDFVTCGRFLHSPKANWAEVVKDGWVARTVDMTREAGVARFGDVFEQVPLKEHGGASPDDSLDDGYAEAVGRAAVWEIWDAKTRRVVWISRDWQDRVLDELEDPLGLEGFFPCPKPAFGTMGNDKLCPVPDYLQYSRLAEELDEQTGRIDRLTKALRAKGFYDGSLEGIENLLADDNDVMVKVDGMHELFGKGSGGGQVTGVVQFLPIAEIAKVLIGLYDARDRTKATLYEVSGISDILRGSVDPREKLGQSRMKSQHAGQRIETKKRVIETFARDLIRMKAEIICEHYDPERIRALSGFDYMPQVIQLRQSDPNAVEQVFARALSLLRDEKTRGFRVEIETNSTVLADDAEEKEQRIEFLKATGEFLGQSLPVMKEAPEMAPILSQMLLFAVRSFRSGRQLEGVFEETIQRLQQGQGQPGESERQAQVQGEQQQQSAQIRQAEMQAKMAQLQATTQSKANDAQLKIATTKAQAEAEVQKAELEIAVEQAKAQAEILKMEAELEKARKELEMKERAAMTEVAA